MEEDEEYKALGWDAIDKALKPLYQDQEPLHFAPDIYMIGGEDPLDGISAYRNYDPIPHWHYVTYGLSDLYGLEDEQDDGCSKFGFELTFRLKVDKFEDNPPMWVFDFLQNIAKYVFESGRYFEVGHRMHANGSIGLDSATEICAITFVTDAQLGGVRDTPHGKLEFLQVVGLTQQEYDALRGSGKPEEIIMLLEKDMPLFITDMDRKSLL